MFIEEINSDKVHVRQLVISMNYQKSGIGKTLIECLKEHYNQIFLDTHTLNEEAKEFYQKLGFVFHGQLHNEELPSKLYCGFTWQKKDSIETVDKIFTNQR